MTKEQTIERISEILNNTGAHIELEQLAMENDVHEFDCEILADAIEKMIAHEITKRKSPREFTKDAEGRHWEAMATHNERFCD